VIARMANVSNFQTNDVADVTTLSTAIVRGEFDQCIATQLPSHLKFKTGCAYVLG